MGELESHGLVSKILPSSGKNDPKVSQKNLGGWSSLRMGRTRGVNQYPMRSHAVLTSPWTHLPAAEYLASVDCIL